MENHTDIETLLTKYFEGNTTPPENEQIEAWLNADEEHLRIAKQLNTLYLAVDTQHITKKIDTEKALDKVKSRTKVRNLSWWGWTQRIAAILSVPLLIGVLALYPDRQQPVVTAQMVEIKTNEEFHPRAIPSFGEWLHPVPALAYAKVLHKWWAYR